MANFYCNVFEMEIVNSMPNVGAYFLSDGHMNLAILPHTVEGSAPCGLNHFGFQVEDAAEIGRRMAAEGVNTPKARPTDRPYAELRGADTEGNMFDISEHGYLRAETNGEQRKKVGV